MSDPELKLFLKNIAETKSDRRLRSFSEEQLDEYIEYFINVRPHLTHPWMVHDYEDRIKLLRKDKDRRSSQRQHDEAIRVAKQNLNWKIILGIAGLLVLLVPLIVHNCSRSSSKEQGSFRSPSSDGECGGVPSKNKRAGERSR